MSGDLLLFGRDRPSSLLKLGRQGATDLEAVVVGIVEPEELVVAAPSERPDRHAATSETFANIAELSVHDEHDVAVPIVVLRAPLFSRR